MKGKNEKMEKILKAAIFYFSKKGYDRATIDEIARKSGVSKGTVFFYFKKKEKLIEKISLLSVPLDQIYEINQRNYSNPKDILKDFGLLFLNKYNDPNMRNLLIMTMAFKNRYTNIEKALETLCFQEMDKMFNRVENLYGKEIPFTMRRAFFGALMCYVIWWNKNIMGPSEYVEKLVDQILYNVKVSRE
ncbi:MAG: TetR/AcrR family transcriptional regulator [Thermoplasmata archaeon]